ncbi:hypothetical protein UF75_5115 [Desulfosporosinus sp. I2]|uniref:hypothetical protein n=1 Tax=Desulfosporosinus sp. I2 TaxID=1617025 RepID=UPI00061F3338|nr:hypothetical protein [Desulfosporosinus sp. I2]KJR44499.1 hypothetical protein UF75_5115 [Desulfosporosinus sp. I2]
MDHDRQNLRLKQYLNKYFSSTKIEQLVGEFSFSELRKLLGEMDIEFFASCYFPKYFDRKFWAVSQGVIRRTEIQVRQQRVDCQPKEI